MLEHDHRPIIRLEVEESFFEVASSFGRIEDLGWPGVHRRCVFHELRLVLSTVHQVEGLIDDDDIPEVKESRVVRGDIWKLGEHRVMCGDSTSSDDVEKLMNG